MNRRRFLKAATAACCAGAAFPISRAFAGPNPGGPHVREAYFYRKLQGGTVQCQTCPHECVLTPGRRGRCRAKENFDGRLYTLSYGNPCTVNVDPIEKKPLLHFFPGTRAFSLAVAGCNFRCLNCQNWEISQTSPDLTRNYVMPPEKVVALAKKYRCRSIAYTYSESISFYEYMLDTATLAREHGIKNVWVSNAYIRQEPLKRLLKVTDAACLNLKTFDDKIYMDLNGGHLQPVLETLKTVREKGVWLEIINLVVPTYTDNLEQIAQMCDWINGNLGAETPLMFSRFVPKYKLVHLPPTPVELMTRAAEKARSRGLQNVYIGNVAGQSNAVVCSQCGKTVVRRRGYAFEESLLQNGQCPFCQAPVAGRWAG